MALNTFIYKYLTPLHFKGLRKQVWYLLTGVDSMQLVLNILTEFHSQHLHLCQVCWPMWLLIVMLEKIPVYIENHFC